MSKSLILRCPGKQVLQETLYTLGQENSMFLK